MIDLAALSQHGLFMGPHLQRATCFEQVSISRRFHDNESTDLVGTVVQDTLNNFMSLGKSAWTEARKTITQLFTHSAFSLEGNDDVLSEVVIPMVDCLLYNTATRLQA